MAHELLAQIALEEHHIAQAGYCAIRALDKGQQMAVLTPVVARSYALLLQFLAVSGASKLTVQKYQRKALDLAHRLEEVLMLSYTLLAVGSISVSAARWKEGRDNLVQAEQIVVQFKDAQLWENVVSQRAHLEFYHGNFAQSKELYEQAHASAAARGDPKIQNRCMMGIAGILIAQNQVAVVVVVLVVAVAMTVTVAVTDGRGCCCGCACCCGDDRYVCRYRRTRRSRSSRAASRRPSHGGSTRCACCARVSAPRRSRKL